MNETLDAQATLRDYLLHKLDEADQERVEERILGDREFGRRVAMAQDDLIDDYVAGNLSGSDLESFRRYFVSPSSRVEKLKFATALHRYVSEQEPTAAASPLRRRVWDSVKTSPPRVVAYAAIPLVAVVGLLFVFNLGVGRFWREAALNRELAHLNKAQGPGPISLQELRNGSADTLALTLRQNLVREDPGARTAKLTGSMTVLRLLLEMTTGSHDTYRAVLESSNNEELAVVENLKAREAEGAQFIVVNLPAQHLHRGTYQLRLIGLDGDGRSTEVNLYPFEVVNK